MRIAELARSFDGIADPVPRKVMSKSNGVGGGTFIFKFGILLDNDLVDSTELVSQVLVVVDESFDWDFFSCARSCAAAD